LKREEDGFPAIMKFLPIEIKDAPIIKLNVFKDDRGFFMETFQG